MKKVGDPVNGFSRFTLVGRNANAVICDRCDVIDANLPSRGDVSLQDYPADLHLCVSRERKRHQVMGSYLSFKAHIFSNDKYPIYYEPFR